MIFASPKLLIFPVCELIVKLFFADNNPKLSIFFDAEILRLFPAIISELTFVKSPLVNFASSVISISFVAFNEA